MKTYLSIALFWFSLLPYSNAQTTLTDSIYFQGMYRTYLLHLPASYGNAPMPLVMGLHGGGPGDGENLMQRTHFDELGEIEGFITLFPNGVFHDWADGRGVTDSEIAGIDDVGFLTTLIDSLQAAYLINPQRIYVWGASNGGMMAQRLACEASEKFAAFASIISSMPEPLATNCNPSDSSIPVLLMNGTEDNWVPYEGGPLGPLTDGGSTIGTDSTITFWRNHNNCTDNFEQTDFPDIDPFDNSTATRYRYAECNDAAEVVLYRIEGGGHLIPGMESNTNPIFLLGYINYDISAAEEIWGFFSSFLLTKTREKFTTASPIKIYPNPTSYSLYLERLTNSTPILNVQLTNALGVPIYPPTSTQEEKLLIDLSHLPKGIYFLHTPKMPPIKIVKQ